MAKAKPQRKGSHLKSVPDPDDAGAKDAAPASEPAPAAPAPPKRGDLKTEVVDIAELHPWEGNPRRGDLDAIEASLRRFGQQRPIVATESGLILAGANTWRTALERLEWKTIRVTRSKLSESEGIAYLVADNGTADRAEYDDSALLDVLSQVAGGTPSEGLVGTGFGAPDLQSLLDRVDPAAPPEFPAVGGGDGSGGVDTEHECPRCGYSW